MLVEGQVHDCKPCQGAKIKAPAKQKAGILMGIFLAVLPKCPFCIVAYSSTMALCSGKTVAFGTLHASPLTITITVVIGLVILGSILLNFRDKRTIYAFALALTGLGMVLYSVIIEFSPWLYYSGVGVVFAGAWLNGSLLNYLRKMNKLVLKRRITI
ncbi:MAG: hypothetical protein HUU01_11095 [Saprospiraceae bacterium]|nr:hypothetical protein [Saprospiraceae bacterium]